MGVRGVSEHALIHRCLNAAWEGEEQEVSDLENRRVSPGQPSAPTTAGKSMEVMGSMGTASLKG